MRCALVIRPFFIFPGTAGPVVSAPHICYSCEATVSQQHLHSNKGFCMFPTSYECFLAPCDFLMVMFIAVSELEGNMGLG